MFLQVQMPILQQLSIHKFDRQMDWHTTLAKIIHLHILLRGDMTSYTCILYLYEEKYCHIKLTKVSIRVRHMIIQCYNI